MQARTPWSLALAAVLALALNQAIQAASPALTTISIADLHCAGCAKKVASKLLAVTGVASVQTNVEAGTATVAPKPEIAPSPRALWEAVEKAGKKPVKLEGPAGTFTSKPQG
jgi:Cu+-exporting ATPase